MIVKEKRALTLLEVLIAFTLVVLCIFPLIAPHVAIVQQQALFNKKIEVDHLANLLYGLITVDLYNQKYSLEEMKKSEGITGAITETMLQNVGRSGPPLKGSYKLKAKYQKESSETGEGAYLISLTFTFEEVAEKPLVFEYLLFVLRIPPAANEGEKSE